MVEDNKLDGTINKIVSFDNENEAKAKIFIFTLASDNPTELMIFIRYIGSQLPTLNVKT